MKARFLSTSILTLATASALSQELPTTPSVASPASAQASGPIANADQRFDLRFPGGTVKEFVALVNEKVGRPLNIIVPRQVDALRIPPLEVYRVTVSSLFKVVESLAEGVSFQAIDNDRAGTIWVVKYSERENVSTEREVRYFPIADFLPRFTIEDITTAIETGWELQSNVVQYALKPAQSTLKPTLKFHEETKLLICAATSQQLDIVPQVLKGLTQVPFPKNDKILRKANNIFIPRLEFREATVREGIEFIRKKSLDCDNPNEVHRGVDIVLDQTNGPAEHQLTVSLANVSVLDALKTVASLARLELEVRETVIMVKTPVPAAKNETSGAEADSDKKDTGLKQNTPSVPANTPAPTPQEVK